MKNSYFSFFFNKKSTDEKDHEDEIHKNLRNSESKESSEYFGRQDFPKSSREIFNDSTINNNQDGGTQQMNNEIIILSDQNNEPDFHNSIKYENKEEINDLVDISFSNDSISKKSYDSNGELDKSNNSEKKSNDPQHDFISDKIYVHDDIKLIETGTFDPNFDEMTGNETSDGTLSDKEGEIGYFYYPVSFGSNDNDGENDQDGNDDTNQTIDDSPDDDSPDNHSPDNHSPDNHSPDNHSPDNNSPDNHSPKGNELLDGDKLPENEITSNFEVDIIEDPENDGNADESTIRDNKNTKEKKRRNRRNRRKNKRGNKK
jgi:hypothetical protein